MSSFKRKVPSAAPPPPPGTKALGTSSSGIPQAYNTSTGIASLDDLLGGGLPLGCTLSLLAPDVHSAFGGLVARYAIAQGLVSGQRIVLVDEEPGRVLGETMWVPRGSVQEKEKEEALEGEGDKIKIAWRYEGMKQFRTTVEDGKSDEAYCRTFDLTSRIPEDVRKAAVEQRQLMLHTVQQSEDAVQDVLKRVEELASDGSTLPLRICVPVLGSPSWGDLTDRDVLRFLNKLRAIVRNNPHTCAFVALAPHLSTEKFGGPGWIQKLGWMSDGCLTLAAFTSDPGLCAAFPTHHGLLHIHTLPSPTSLVPPSDRLSTLRGLSSGGENNLGFRAMRRRLLFETVHLDVEGGVGERRTSAPVVAEVMQNVTSAPTGSHEHGSAASGLRPAKIEVAIEEENTGTPLPASTPPGGKKAKKKSVGFRADRADLEF